MKVRELIDKLEKLDLDKEVLILLNDDNPLESGSYIEEVFEITGTEMQDGVFLKEG